MRTRAEFEEVMRLVGAGVNHSQIARRTGISRAAIRDWKRRKTCPGSRGWGPGAFRDDCDCPRCGTRDPATLATPEYVYLLGLYLGDGYISRPPRGSHNLRIVLDNRYPGIIAECTTAMEAVSQRSVGFVPKIGCTEVRASWKHWPCLFPQHGPGRKHERPIVLASWQQELVDLWPARLLRGLIHSDGCRILNWVNGTAYPRYFFDNASGDIRQIFCDTCDAYGVRWRQSRPRTISVARRPDVARLDEVIGPKA